MPIPASYPNLFVFWLRRVRDLGKLADRRVHFLKRPVFESYLMHSAAIASVLNAELGESIVTDEVVERAMKSAKKEKAAGSLKMVFRELSNHRVEYTKTRHSVAIVDWLLEKEPVHLSELKDELIGALHRN